MVNIVNPEEIVVEMGRIAPPGGTVALQEPDCEYWMCDPPHLAWDRLHAEFTTTHRQAVRRLMRDRPTAGVRRRSRHGQAA